MKAHLMYSGRDVDLEPTLPSHADDVAQDLELDTVLDRMARGDGYLRERAAQTLHSGLRDSTGILYRQRILADCIEHPAIARELYDLAIEGVDVKRKAGFFWFRDSPTALVQKSIGMLELFAGILRRLRQLADDHVGEVDSDGLRRLFATFCEELDDPYLDSIDHYVRELRFRRGALLSAELGRGNKGTSLVLRRPRRRRMVERVAPAGRSHYSFTVPTRDDNGLRSLGDVRDRGIAPAAAALAQSTDHILSFFTMLRAELAFYVGCLNLHEQLAERGQPICFPVPVDEHDAWSARGLYDVSLVFHAPHRVVGNDVDADGKRMVMITGANQGGKSTFLRSAGLAQLMMQAGMFVGADSYRASVSCGVFTHFKREEDPSMTSGKLDEELARMSAIADGIEPRSLLLCNESFSSTNEREGSEIARELIRAMVEEDVQVLFVTHMYDLADSLFDQKRDSHLFLRAERRPDGTRTFRVLPAKPLPTSHGADSYERIFGGR